MIPQLQSSISLALSLNICHIMLSGIASMSLSSAWLSASGLRTQ